MSTLKSGIALADNEKLVMELEAELWATDPNPIMRVVQTIFKVIAKILGTKVKGFVVITDKRVIEVETKIVCFAFTAGRAVRYILPRSIMDVGYTRQGTFLGCFCPMYYLYYKSITGRINEVLLKGSDEPGAMKAASAFYEAINN
jgi:hypothetical protein